MTGTETRRETRDDASGRVSDRTPSAGIAVALVVAVVAAYEGVLDNDFVSFDDPRYIVGNVHVKLGLTAESIQWAFAHIYSDNWHPLTWLSHMLDVELFGLDPRGHHAMGVALHSLNAVLLFAVFRNFTKLIWPSALAAALFALHPLRVESVAWAAERKDLLSGLFFLLTLLAYSRYVDRRSVGRYLLLFGSFACGLLAKPMLVTVPIVLLVLDFWPLRRALNASATSASPPNAFTGLQLLVEKTPLLALSLASGIVTLYSQSRGSTMKTVESISFIERLQNALVASVTYLRQFVWPSDLAFFYPHPALVEANSSLPFPLSLAGNALVCGALLVAISVIAFQQSRRRPYLIAGWLWFAIMLLPVVGLVQVGDQAYADRYTYLPMIGISMALGYALNDAWSHWGGPQLPATALPNIAGGLICVGALCALGSMSHRQVEFWSSSDRLYNRALEVTDDNYIAAFNLGAALGEVRAYSQAIAYYNLVLQMRPEYAAAHSNMGVALKELGQADLAVEHFVEALRLNPTLFHAAINLGNHAMETHDVDRARSHYEDATAARPDLALPYEVFSEFEQKQGNLDEAVRQLDTALSIEPGSARLHVKRGQLAIAEGADASAVEHFRRALMLDKKLLPAKHALALLLATSKTKAIRNGAEAAVLAVACNEATQFMNPTFLKTLSLAHAETGNLDEAVRLRERALALTPGTDRARLRDEFRAYDFAPTTKTEPSL